MGTTRRTAAPPARPQQCRWPNPRGPEPAECVAAAGVWADRTAGVQQSPPVSREHSTCGRACVLETSADETPGRLPHPLGTPYVGAGREEVHWPQSSAAESGQGAQSFYNSILSAPEYV